MQGCLSETQLSLKTLSCPFTYSFSKHSPGTSSSRPRLRLAHTDWCWGHGGDQGSPGPPLPGAHSPEGKTDIN